jgi:hypothetical protein
MLHNTLFDALVDTLETTHKPAMTFSISKLQGFNISHDVVFELALHYLPKKL